MEDKKWTTNHPHPISSHPNCSTLYTNTLLASYSAISLPPKRGKQCRTLQQCILYQKWRWREGAESRNSWSGQRIRMKSLGSWQKEASSCLVLPGWISLQTSSMASALHSIDKALPAFPSAETRTMFSF